MSYFQFEEESKEDVFNRDDTTNYLKVIVGESEINEEKKAVDVQTLSQNKFSSLLDAISIFITGSDGFPADIPKQHIFKHAPKDLLQLINKKDLRNSALSRPNLVRNKIRQERITGAQIVEIIQNMNLETGNVNIDPVKDLLFPDKLQADMDEEDVKKISSEIIRIIQYMLLRTRVETEFIPNFKNVNKLQRLD